MRFTIIGYACMYAHTDSHQVNEACYAFQVISNSTHNNSLLVRYHMHSSQAACSHAWSTGVPWTYNVIASHKMSLRVIMRLFITSKQSVVINFSSGIKTKQNAIHNVIVIIINTKLTDLCFTSIQEVIFCLLPPLHNKRRSSNDYYCHNNSYAHSQSNNKCSLLH